MTNDIAIKFCDEYLARNIADIDKEFLKKAKEALQQEPCDDCVSRQAVLKMAYDMSEIDGEDFTEPCMVVDVEDIQKLPPVTPQPKTRWIPVSESLPKKFSYVNCTCRSLIDDRASWVIETCYVPQPSNSPYSDWGNIPMLNDGDCEVVAWMYREIPEPYKAEGSEKE